MKVLNALEVFLVEAGFIELTFSSSFNLISSHKQRDLGDYAGLVVAVLVLSCTTMFYLRLLAIAWRRPISVQGSKAEIGIKSKKENLGGRNQLTRLMRHSLRRKRTRKGADSSQSKLEGQKADRLGKMGKLEKLWLWSGDEGIEQQIITEDLNLTSFGLCRAVRITNVVFRLKIKSAYR